ncbi:MAG TPA: acetyl-coenzyme A synthetase N-terminal domain-containing protein, partial [Tianweitania sediminis]|nr:acetyl-coenzyme A synthetase N-terminal domain-containing protein [Tianweitania sediminis]
MTEPHLHPVQAEWKERALIDDATYRAWYEKSVADPDSFWAEHGKRIQWSKPFSRVKNTSFEGDVSIKWFEDGETNVSVNCVDRHLETKGDQVAILWEGDNPAEDKKITYRELHGHVGRFANLLKQQGVKRGDRVTIYMPMIPEAAYAML